MFQWRGRAAMPGAAVPSPALCPALRHGRSARLPDQPFAHPRLCLPCQLQDHLLAPWLITRQTWRPSQLQALRAPSWELEQQGPASKASTLQRAHPRGSPQAPGTGRAPASSPAGNCGFMGSRGQNHTTGVPRERPGPAVCAATEHGLAGDKGQSAASGTESGTASGTELGVKSS